MAELLLEEDYEVHAVIRRAVLKCPEHRLSRVKHLADDIHLHSASLESYPSLFRALQTIQPYKFYRRAAQTFVSYSFEDEFSTLNFNINGSHSALSATGECAPGCWFYFAASSERFGKVHQVSQTEDTPFQQR